MKIKALLLVAVIALGFTTANAQFKFKGITAGIGLGSQSAVNSSDGATMGYGINIGALAGVYKQIDIDANFTYYFPSKPVTGIELDVWTLNLNGHYNFIDENGMSLYGLAGLNYSSATAKVDLGAFGGGSASVTSSKTGLNIGAGGTYNFTDAIGVAGQVGYQTGLDQVFINAGIIYSFK